MSEPRPTDKPSSESPGWVPMIGNCRSAELTIDCECDDAFARQRFGGDVKAPGAQVVVTGTRSSACAIAGPT